MASTGPSRQRLFCPECSQGPLRTLTPRWPHIPGALSSVLLGPCFLCSLCLTVPLRLAPGLGASCRCQRQPVQRGLSLGRGR